MRAINHALTGAVIGLTISQPAVAVPVAFASHFALDMVPHFGNDSEAVGGKNFRNWLVADALLCVALVAVLLMVRPHYWWLAALCAFAAAAPDLASAPRFFALQRGRRYQTASMFIRLAKRIQWFERPIGAVVEITWFGAVIFILMGILWPNR